MLKVPVLYLYPIPVSFCRLLLALHAVRVSTSPGFLFLFLFYFLNYSQITIVGKLWRTIRRRLVLDFLGLPRLNSKVRT